MSETPADYIPPRNNDGWGSTEPRTCNATIRSTMLGVEDHGILTCMIHLDYGGGGQGFGGYAFDRYLKDFDRRQGTAWGMEFIRCVLDTLKIEQWEKLPGTPVRVVTTHTKVLKIGHFIEERWFDPSDLGTLFDLDKTP